MRTKLLCLALALLVAVAAPSALAGKKKKKPKSWKSEEVTVTVPHPVFYGQTQEVNNVTAQEFESSCAIPNSQGFDAWVFEVPKPYQKLDAALGALGSGGTYDLDVFFYDADCAIKMASQAEGTDESAFMPAGTAWVLVHNYLGDPNVSFHIEIKP